ncbi:MAG: dephospho-CoA kinase [Alphaproteobacteria bacterium]|nr:dephospho-CoA kinase [Alphaproteobacteria bacterium]
MGKSTAAAMLREAGLPVFDADAEVHRMMAAGGAAVARIDAAFPGTVCEGAVNRRALGDLVFADTEALRRLERIVHPLVGRAERAFLRRAARERRRAVVRDVPLLFETGGEKRCDWTVVVSAPAHVQAARVLARPGVTRELLESVRAKQTPDAEKRKRANVVVPTGAGRRLTRDRLKAMLRRRLGNGDKRHA